MIWYKNEMDRPLVLHATEAARLARECCDTTLTTFDVMKGFKW
jgi:hypothetical protein